MASCLFNKPSKPMIFLLTFGGLGAVGSLLLIHAMLFAPEGYEDQQGFHVINSQEDSGNAPAPNPLTTADLLFFGR